tara:strand:+ start:62 stop:649 length:588 start_codon:yes stop_codon:yes gene_type:complete
MKTALCFFLISFFSITSHLISKSNNLINDLLKTGKHDTFARIIERSPLFLSILNNSINSTIYAPTDQAFEDMPDLFLKDIEKNNTKVVTKLILSHIFKGDSLNENKDKNNTMVLTLDGSLYFTYDSGDLFIKDIVSRGEKFVSGFYKIIPTDCVMFLQPSTNDIRLDKKIREKYKFTTCCLQTKQELEEFYTGLQ